MKKSLVPLKLYIYLYPLLAVGLVLFVSILFSIPQVKYVKETWDGLATKKDRLEKLEQKRQMLSSIDEQTLATLTDAQLALPDEKDPASVMTGIDNLSAQNKLFIDNLQFSPLQVAAASVSSTRKTAVDKRPANVVSFVIQARGETAQMRDFISQLTNSRRLFDIDSLEVIYQKDLQDNISVRLALVAYYLPSLTQIGEIESILPPLTNSQKQTAAGLTNMPYISSPALTADQATPVQAVGKANLFTP